MKRGALIVFEGIDRSGKSTQCRALVENLKKKGIAAVYTNFPDRTTEIGGVINNYLNSKNNFSDRAIHLLFSVNRWEKCQYILQTLEAGTSVIVDRYCYSGVAFSAAKGLDFEWCKSPDKGLPKPDRVFYFNMPLETIEARNGFGNERYEVLDFQKKVSEMYKKLKEDYWETINANRSINIIQDELLEKSVEIINNVNKPIGEVWS